MHDGWNYHLSPSPSACSSTRSSHLSVLTNTSSSSPPPSPTGSKTHAFFASPFSDDASPQPPPSPSGRTHAFFASPFTTDAPLPPPNPHTRQGSDRSERSVSSSQVSTDDTPRAPHKVPARSLNADFFAPSFLPTPPPSIRSVSTAPSRDNSTSPPSSRIHLPPLSRLFPSRVRYGSEHDPSHTNVRRDFLHLESGVSSQDLREQYHAGEQTESPVDLHHPHPGSPPESERRHLPPPLTSSATSSSQTTPRPTLHGDKSYLSSQRPPSPPPSDPEQTIPYLKLEPGVTLSSSSLSLELVKPLGTGSFSSVWLARDTQGQLNALELVRKSSLARSKSLRGRRSRIIDGTRPLRRKPKDGSATDANAMAILSPKDEGPMKILGRKFGRLVAVKMTERAACDANSRSRVSFVREVEVLRHISHPSIVSYLHSFSTPSHHCLVLEHVGGGELLDLVDNPVSHARITEPLVRRIWGELCRAVAWMHSVGLVHRDIKLENILLTSDPFAEPLPSQSLIKLTDFGLSRFIDPEQPLLTTLCGSDSYAAPELVMGKPYDGRQTDAWACGVVLYALATRRLPFDAPSPNGMIPHDQPPRIEADWEVQRKRRAERKGLLNRIAQGDYSWPEVGADVEEPRRGLALAGSAGIRRMVARLLVRDPRKRARVVDLWADECGWMHGEGAPPPPVLDNPPGPPSPAVRAVDAEDAVPIVVNGVDGDEIELDVDADLDAEADDEGVLVDVEDIGPGSVARQEH
ncbi:kinase-like protein [Lentinus tigrinus ALCF2SS1-7]|uniref:Kinase-like protein n=1 Tax=Lentinus tigrinus ALCF2SS1-6 TaxID=1328759 RepID=A0A5C2S888_9APHY|nr:kinase-like protein [Lentinus tigrinus ALCF2SS1-6]RPD73621.1 kinase-like protein [Lentinus tigrinus ALCF2SS1-7]